MDKIQQILLGILGLSICCESGVTEELDTCLRWEIRRKVTVYHCNISKAVEETGNVIEVNCLPLNVFVHAFERVLDFP